MLKAFKLLRVLGLTHSLRVFALAKNLKFPSFSKPSTILADFSKKVLYIYYIIS